MHRRNFLRRTGAATLAAATFAPFLAPYARGAGPDLPTTFRIDDSDGVLGRTGAPVQAKIVRAPERILSRLGRLAVKELGKPDQAPIPVQGMESYNQMVCFFMPPGEPGMREFKLVEVEPAPPRLTVQRLDGPLGGHFEMTEGDNKILRYNHTMVEPGDVLNAVSADNRKYAVARTDYIHPLFGLSGEPMTYDWSVDHPHHRGIYWAWPEVDWDGKRGDLHALQNVFARPGQHWTAEGPVFSEVRAGNVWKWEGQDPIVNESICIRAYRAGKTGRLIDLELSFSAVDKPVQIARRGTNAYGGLNIRMSAIADQKFAKFTAPAEAHPRAVWSDASGKFGGAATPAGLAVFQIDSNPDYPGDWIEFPDLNWLQPTFPASGTRFELQKGRGLTLHYRLWVHPDGPLEETAGKDAWLAANSRFSPLKPAVDPLKK